MDNFSEYYGDNSISEEVATSITGGYMTFLFEDRQRQRFAQEFSDLELNDVNENLNNLKLQIQLLNDIGIRKFPCLKIGESKIPIDIFQYIEDLEKRRSIVPEYFNYYLSRNYYEEIFYRFFDLIEESNEGIISTLNFDNLRENIHKALSNFIGIRHASFFNQNIKSRISNFFGGSSPTTPSSGSSTKYLTVTVNTAHYGLDISASPAYFVSWKKFGGPTSPVNGYLLPGTYIFGGAGVSSPSFKHDSTPVDVPPNFNISLTII